MIVESRQVPHTYEKDGEPVEGYRIEPDLPEWAENFPYSTKKEGDSYRVIFGEQSFTISTDETTVYEPVVVKIKPAWKTEKLFINGERKETIEPENGVAEAEIVFEEVGLYEIHWNGENRYVEVV